MNQQNSNPLALLLELEARTRSFENLEELQYFLINEPHQLVPFRQAVLFDGNGKVCALSGVSSVDKNTPFVQWLNATCPELFEKNDDVFQIETSQLDDQATQWLPSHLLFIALKDNKGRHLANVMFARDENWQEGPVSLLHHLVSATAFAWEKFQPRINKKVWSHIPKPVKLVASIALILALFFPVHLSVLAPAEIIARDPVVIRAPMNGILKDIKVSPNEKVEKANVLFRMDDSDLQNERLLSVKKLQGLAAQYKQLTRQALVDPKSKARLTILAANIKEQQVELARVDDFLKRTQILSPQKGTVILDNADDWIGRPVQVGERVLALADEKHIEVEAWLSVGDAITLPIGSDAKIFLNASPLSPLSAKIRQVSFQAIEKADGIMAHRVLATMQGEIDRARLGAQGTARLEGERVTLFYWIFRRPISAIRQFLGI